jgi:hypothetical protein
MSEKYDTMDTQLAICPHCGRADRNSFELSPCEGDGEIDCVFCGQPFLWSRNTTITYTTKKKETQQ